MSVDMFICAIGLLSFVLFFIVHILFSRYCPPEGVLKDIMRTALIGIGINVALGVGLIHLLGPLDAAVDAMAILCALVMYGMCVFVYILCIFGPYETSIRMRIVRQVARAPQGLSQSQLLNLYNAQGIVRVRLKRLIAAGDIQEQAGVYRIVKKRNMFFVIDVVALQLKKWINA